ncbi:MAG: hypothetical protein Q4A27_02835 [bacterium]|nr:hypothetical protein [bacterium]
MTRRKRIILGIGLIVVLTAIVSLMFSLGGGNATKTEAKAKGAGTESTTVANTSKKDESYKEFEVIPYGENPQGKVIPNNSDSDSLSGSVSEKVKTLLSNAAHKPQALENYSRQLGLKIPNDMKWKQEVEGKEYLSKEAQDLYWKLEAILLGEAKTEHVDNIGVTGYASGVQNGELIQGEKFDYSNWSGVKITYKGYTFYTLDYCGNTVTPSPIPGVKKIPKVITPPEQPSKKTPPPKEQLEPKKAEQDPAQQGNAPIGGGRNATSTVEEPADNTAPSFPNTYQAPAPQNGGGAQNGGTSGLNDAPSGSFSDANGQTTVNPNGSVQTPNGNYRPLVGVTPPPVQNPDTNSGVNNGAVDANTIPVD